MKGFALALLLVVGSRPFWPREHLDYASMKSNAPGTTLTFTGFL